MYDFTNASTQFFYFVYLAKLLENGILMTDSFSSWTRKTPDTILQ
jgi:hypothetical protein